MTPEPWQTNAAGPFVTIGAVEIWALAGQRFKIVSPSGEVEVEGFQEARQRAHEMAREVT